MTDSDFYSPTDPNYHPDQELLHAFLDKELNQEDAERLKHHLDLCPACRENFEQLKSLFSQLEELPEIPLEGSYTTEILHQVKQQQKLFQGLTWTAVLQAAAAGIILGLVLPILPYQEWNFTFQSFLSQFQTNAAANFSRMISEWSLGWDAFSQSIPAALENLLSADFILLDLSEPLLLVIAAAGLGLLANGILLRGSSLNWHSNLKSRT